MWFDSFVVWDSDRVDGWLVEGWPGYAVYFHILSMWLHCAEEDVRGVSRNARLGGRCPEFGYAEYFHILSMWLHCAGGDFCGVIRNTRLGGRCLEFVGLSCGSVAVGLVEE